MIEDIRGAASGFGVRWTVLCGLGLAGGLAVGLGLAAPVEAVVGMMLVTPVILALAGSMFGAAQWLALGRNRGSARHGSRPRVSASVSA